MDVFAILQTIIALIFIYLIISLIVTELQEQLATLFQWRARNLKKAIEIFTGSNPSGDSSNPSGGSSSPSGGSSSPSGGSSSPSGDSSNLNIANKLYKSNSLFSGFNQYADNPPSLADSIGPSYVEKEVFAESLMGIIQAELKDLSDKKGQNLTLSPNQPLFPKIEEKHITEILEKLSSQYPALIERLKEIAYITKLKHDDPTVENFTAEIANTFDEIMERTTGVYKRNAKGVSLLLGLGVAIFFNVDTFHIVDRLYTDPDLRQGFDDLATKMIETNNTCLENSTIEECRTNLEKETDRIKTSLAEAQSLPIGWDENGWFNLEQLKSQNYGQAVLGWFVSAIAISMGSPFWFELLGKVINVRNTVRPLSSKEVTKVTKPQ